MGEGRAADITLAASSDRVWTDDVHRPTAGASEGRGDSTVRGLRRAPRAAKPQSSVDGRSGRRASRQRDFGSYTGWAKKVIPLVQCNICTRGITFLAHPVYQCHTDRMYFVYIGRVLKYAPGCFEVLLCRSFMIKRTAQ